MKYMFKFPDIGEGLEEGKIIEWYVEKGQSVSSGDPLVKMETDKVVTDIPSPKSGVISQRFGAVGETVHVGNALVEIDIEGVEGTAAIKAAAEVPAPPASKVVEEKGFGVVGTIEVAGDGAYLPSSGEGLEMQPSMQQADKPRKVLATPVARAMAKDLGVDINLVSGTGPAGRVTKKDVEKSAHGSAGLSTGASERAGFRSAPLMSSLANEDVNRPGSGLSYQPLSMIRKTIAKNMTRSKQNAVHMSVMDEVEASELVEARKRLKPRFEALGLKLSYLPFIIKAVSLALREHPILNAELDLENERIIHKDHINIGIAVDTDDGLVVPVIRDADQLSIQELAARINDFSVRAPKRQLSLDELKGGTFSITSYGSIGGYFAVPVINYPQAAIFGIGRLTQKPVIKDGQIAIGNVLPISMSVDHRIVDGGEVARFLNLVLEYLKDPLLMLSVAPSDKGANHAV
ncbi:MAG TPA: dihydrolipoamide acetyltransferase family protein [Candidatus Cloacimonadota bacterium]|nr:dihydrolipoamide acetyltransferase family protein [Candidatus Cloacimonadota bacterium]